MHTTIDEIGRSGARLGASVAALSDADLRAPCALPGWTRGHVVAHVARSVDAYLWLLALARTGAEPAPRQGADAITRAVQDGAGRPAAELTADLGSRLARLAEECVAMPADAWDTLVPALAGWLHPAWYTLHRAWREFETHHVDLDVGYRTADWPAEYVAWALDDTAAALRAREFPVARIEAVDLGRAWTLSPTGPQVSGPGHAVLGWLSGRLPDTALAAASADRLLPTPPSWPMPPSPAWT
ncbi:maleylpyruvate isomerase [Kitasatospora sp. MAP12-15]|uniref:maleylpyruvate isomerase family mycothiol-dependent enzyme n=1 Tax=unclassified Kitasatospora TaxID=2633591 RepID=UPI002476C016|nr:maleylpyruvate isomerase family mycothiol-dependent enzyme [Kitasatospora sp. MAP12-44]MDH6108728.1 maleylpyruvate isomerase [Kitasatospora sp. MAP12-44]